ncbi:hypothetical protein EZJ19_15060 [Parasulfuritortus cantonensis]|uniref:Type IV secretion system putative lipoprotein virB7 n=1 Tax=Parasulfuritortus cantonensis TaxID=2528202 RepID=A0A4R1B7A3_9PROT|nr:lipoprotein [Parasulfuritortus cantonensis]TCJ11593.1 hypothetical protein EZJ19_15060 [Parasulfuritortus cantonensis]
MKKRLLIAAGLLLALAGCNKLTVENYDKIAVGMPYDDVVGLIGKPKQCDDLMGLRSCTWGDDKRSVQVNFAGDKVLLFASKGLH